MLGDIMESIDRFVDAQKEDFERALNEIRNGHKETHWMWYIFPQIHDLGYSFMSRTYEIKSINEAIDYLNNDYLKNNLETICNALLDLEETKAVNIFGIIDTMKLKSSMTLFDFVSPSDIYRDVLDKYFHGELDDKTIDIINEELLELEQVKR
jgi:uncharacterized protein (DUF1810 family)